jgi:hypothetical protein
MLTRRLSLMAVAAAFAVSSSAALLQSARPALADADDHHPRAHQRFDRDDRHRARPDRDDRYRNRNWYTNGNRTSYNTNGNHTAYWNAQHRNWNNNGNHNGWRKHRDRDHDHDRR